MRQAGAIGKRPPKRGSIARSYSAKSTSTRRERQLHRASQDQIPNSASNTPRMIHHGLAAGGGVLLRKVVSAIRTPRRFLVNLPPARGTRDRGLVFLIAIRVVRSEVVLLPSFVVPIGFFVAVRTHD